MADVAAAAKKSLRPGEILGREGGRAVYGSLVSIGEAQQQRLLPIGFCAGGTVTRPVAEDQMLSYEDVKLHEGGFAYHLRLVQDGTPSEAPRSG